jgi:hypothetical protein
MSALCKSIHRQQFRVAIKDFDDEKAPSIVGYFRTTVDDLLTKAGHPEKAFIVRKGKAKKEVGTVQVMLAKIVGENSKKVNTSRDLQESEISTFTVNDIDEDIVVEATDDIAILPDELEGGPQFADFVAGGCQLRLSVAIGTFQDCWDRIVVLFSETHFVFHD